MDGECCTMFVQEEVKGASLFHMDAASLRFANKINGARMRTAISIIKNMGKSEKALVFIQLAGIRYPFVEALNKLGWRRRNLSPLAFDEA